MYYIPAELSTLLDSTHLISCAHGSSHSLLNCRLMEGMQLGECAVDVGRLFKYTLQIATQLTGAFPKCWCE